jgi:hypothetical protein
MRTTVRAFIGQKISRGSLSGPLQHVSCTATGAPHELRAFRCTVLAGSVGYDFLGVVDPKARRITYCKRDPPPAASDNVRVSRRCLA